MNRNYGTASKRRTGTAECTPSKDQHVASSKRSIWNRLCSRLIRSSTPCATSSARIDLRSNRRRSRGCRNGDSNRFVIFPRDFEIALGEAHQTKTATALLGSLDEELTEERWDCQ